ncbi:2-oxoacid:ferredoxin oxidoreductase subunit beta [Solemya velesiana gill symbiont]|uniref:2-oxoglutarate synthase n=1 Tax=Solemya velesiana gill symbiont TaxID=1918948 RepID=A0A1T2KY06_9GAMM|nr:2-oxoacid:ferredoxin oxidoreductase subunit beta [Solemya velesiana gill symbiont]OOZ37747.1 2-oxoglutarate synthase [Solemya velesiana gill symbiont]
MTETQTQPALKAKDYKSDIKPVWCPGSGHFAVLSALSKALAHLALKREDVAMVSGIGCSSRLPAYTEVYGFHGVHGRALAVAGGLKAARPDLTVIAAGGDGDGFSIGGNHFLHACRRNMDITYIVMDNEVYGMTKGQASPTTSPDWSASKLTPHGPGVPSFNPAAIALASGATFIARGFSGDPNKLTQMIVEGIQHKGFSFIHVFSPCTTFRPEQKGWKKQVHEYAEEVTANPVKTAQGLQADDGMGTGLIYRTELPPWQPAYDAICEPSALEKEFQV